MTNEKETTEARKRTYRFRLVSPRCEMRNAKCSCVRNAKCLCSCSGFTLIELLVTTSIFIIITLVVLTNYPRANGAIALRLLANDVALSIREAQVYGVSIKALGTGAGTVFPDYGMYFKVSSPQDYFLFADLNGNRAYDEGTCSGGGSSVSYECDEDYAIHGVNEIRKLCGLAPSSGVTLTKETCYNQSDAVALKELTVLFHRPNPDAIMSGKRTDDMSASALQVTGILLGNATETNPDKMKMVEIWSTGQITIQ